MAGLGGSGATGALVWGGTRVCAGAAGALVGLASVEAESAEEEAAGDETGHSVALMGGL